MSTYQTTEYLKQVPLDYAKPEGTQIEFYAREIVKSGNEEAPRLVFFQGGPGFPSPRDIEATNWLKYALDHFRVVLPDQRGTGKSQRIGPETAKQFKTPEALADYLSNFRADHIVKDAERLRKEEFGGEKWFSLGQSYGGFITTTYLSFAPEGLLGSMITGGLAPINKKTVKEVYQANLENVYKRNVQFYQDYPENKAKVKRLLELLEQEPLELADGDTFTAKRLLDAGMILGTTNGPRKLNFLLDNPFLDSKQEQISWAFATSIKEVAYETNPIFAFLHESIYCDGPKASGWAAETCLEEDTRFSIKTEDAVCFRGECIQSRFFEDYAQLRPFAKAAELLAKKQDWKPLYDFERLAQNEVPVEAYVYDTDFYVDLQGSLDCADSIKGCNVTRHPEWQHDSIHTHTEDVLGTLIQNIKKRT